MASKNLRIKLFHVLGSSGCPWCTRVQGCIMMYLRSVAAYDRHVCYHDRDTQEGQTSWQEEVAHVVPASHRTIPCVVAEFSDGTLKYIGGVEQFVRKFGCEKRD